MNTHTCRSILFYGILLFLVDYYFNIFQFPRVTPQPGVKATLPRWERQASPQLREGLATLPRQGLVTPLPLAPTTLPQQEGLASLQQLERHLAATHPQLLGSEVSVKQLVLFLCLSLIWHLPLEIVLGGWVGGGGGF